MVDAQRVLAHDHLGALFHGVPGAALADSGQHPSLVSRDDMEALVFSRADSGRSESV